MIRRDWLARLCWTLLPALLLGACASLRPDVPKPPSQALAPDPASPLGWLAAQVTPAAQPSAFRPLEAGHDALAARLALAEQARHSLDLQYYIFRDDASGKLLVQALLAAADRGVRVRLLLDDMYTAENEAAILALDAHPHIEIRLYNPFRYRAGGLVRAAEFLNDRERLNRRMHNKLFLADNQMGITGGRNIGDEYFQLDEALAFRDLDVLTAGRVVSELSAAFDAYWNSEPAIPAAALPASRRRARAELDATRAALNAYYAEVGRILAAQLGQDLLGDGAGGWSGGAADLLLDRPEKTADGLAGAAELPATRLLHTGLDARRELLIASPYLVPGKLGSDLLQHLHGKGLKVRILTNSLAANDVILVHAGYARYRLPMLLAGLELYELKPVKERPHVRLGAGSSSSRASLHSKALVFDRQRVYIGSMNLDPRSVLLNTEAGLLIDSPTLAERVAGFIEAAMAPEQSYRVRLDPDSPPEDRRLIWLERRGGEERTHRVEPATDLWLRALVDVLSALPIEEDL
ncbi:MAG TPA: phospholipase D family protein [Thiobacillaceae bacterium]|nr:phospholipase D family protein [Thiobacillaceae bacterium]